MGDLIFYIAAFIFVIALIVLGAWLWRSLLDKGVSIPGNNLFTSARDKRIGFVEQASIDGRRKLILVRRDGVEHLIMTGGPVDVVIETGIENGGVANIASSYPPGPYEPRTADIGAVPQGEDYPPESSLEKRLYAARKSEAASSYRSDD